MFTHEITLTVRIEAPPGVNPDKVKDELIDAANTVGYTSNVSIKSDAS